MKEKTKRKITRIFWTVSIGGVSVVLLLLLLVCCFARIPSFEEIEHPDNKLATQVLAEGGELLATFHEENRTYVPFEELSPHLVHAAVATEDARFYRHSGIDIKGLFRVAIKTILFRDASQGGGSTITQQLAKTLYPRVEVDSDIPGARAAVMVWTKMKEWVTAIKIERNYTKDEIIDMYLNSIFFGSNAYGIRAASETFFAKQPRELLVEEAATLVGMVNKPTRYNPVLNYDRSMARRNFVLDKMASNGYIGKAERDSLKLLPIRLTYTVQDHNSETAPYFRDMLKRQMTASKPRRNSYKSAERYSADSLKWETDDLYGWVEKNRKADGEKYNLDKDGLKIYTTINFKMQQYAVAAISEHLGKDLQKAFNSEMKWKTRRPFSNDVESSVINTLMKNARRWSDRYRRQKADGIPEKEILAGFDTPVRMRVFSWNRNGHVDTVMTPNDSILYYKGILRAAFIAMEPETGHVKAYVGGPNYRYFKYDNVRQGARQVGSTIKPFLYTVAMQEGMDPCTEVVNEPQTFILPNGESWTPRSDHLEERIVTLKWGLAKSSNNVSAYLMSRFGPRSLVSEMRKLGITARLDEVYPLCVGAADISPFEMAAAYNSYPSNGVYVAPVCVTRIEDSDGNVISEIGVRTREVMSENIAGMMTDMMEAVVNQGTGSRLRRIYGLTGSIAGKTGTTNDNSDGWFIGYTPEITAAVWVGCEDRQVHFQSAALGQGASMALPIWGIFARKCIADPATGFSGDGVFPTAGRYAPYSCEKVDVAEGGEDVVEEKQETGEDEEKYYFN